MASRLKSEIDGRATQCVEIPTSAARLVKLVTALDSCVSIFDNSFNEQDVEIPSMDCFRVQMMTGIFSSCRDISST